MTFYQIYQFLLSFYLYFYKITTLLTSILRASLNGLQLLANVKDKNQADKVIDSSSIIESIENFAKYKTFRNLSKFENLG